MKTKRSVLLALVLLIVTSGLFAKKITIKTIPENAQIAVDGSVVGEGSYTLKFNKDNEFYVVTVSAPGYIKKKYKVQESYPNKTYLIKLWEDDAVKASLSSQDAAALANQWIDITCKKGLKEDMVWKRLMSVCTNYFDNISVRDKSAGWIKTNWKITQFPHQIVRTQMEVRMTFTEEDVITYRARITSQIKDSDCEGNECYEKWDRVLNQFEPMIQELQTTVGGGE